MSGEAEPRRSVRATKGQHTKSFDDLEPTVPPKRRQTRKTKKAAQEADQVPEVEEVIRCVCGATEQDEDSGEAWISCETCFAWQHNVCVGVSSFEDEIPDNYWCEQCRPQDHKELLDGIARGERPWEARRRAHEEEEAEQKKKKGGRRGKGKRGSDAKAKEEPDGKSKTTKVSPPVPDVKDKKEVGPSKQGKRKSRDESQDADGKSSKLRRVSERDAFPGPPVKPDKPAGSTTSISELATARAGPAKALKKSISHVIGAIAKKEEVKFPEGGSADGMAEEFALRIERAVFDTHPASRGHKEYNQQIKSLTFNLKNNPELMQGLLHGAHTPETLAVMSSEQLASAEMQKQTAEMRAKAEKQSILYTQETGPRVRKTHKGEEVVEDENNNSINNSNSVINNSNNSNSNSNSNSNNNNNNNNSNNNSDSNNNSNSNNNNSNNNNDAPLPTSGGPRKAGSQSQSQSQFLSQPQPPPLPLVKRESLGGDQGGGVKARSPSQPSVGAAAAGAQQSPSQPQFDIAKVFSTVKSPTASHHRRPSAPVLKTSGPGFDPDVDRLLQDETDSPPYSPTEEGQDADVVWRGSLAMSTIADFHATAKHVGGADFASIGPWSELMPKRMTVAGRIPQQNATEYLCSLRYSSLTEVIVVSLSPTAPESRHEFEALVNYFVSKERYGVVGDKVVGNVRDTYLVPVPAGDGGHPEFMLNLVDNFIPSSRTESMLLAVFVYRNDPDKMKGFWASSATPQPPGSMASPTPGSDARNSIVPRPTVSPATPQTPFAPQAPHGGGGPVQSNTPVPIPQPPHMQRPPPPPPPAAAAAAAAAGGGPSPGPGPGPALPSPPPAAGRMTEAQKIEAQRAGHVLAREILGDLISVPTVQFILPQAHQMSRREWEVIRSIYEKDVRARDDLQYLGQILEKQGTEKNPQSHAATAKTT